MERYVTSIYNTFEKFTYKVTENFRYLPFNDREILQIDLNYIEIDNYTSVSYTHLDVYKRQSLHTPQI